MASLLVSPTSSVLPVSREWLVLFSSEVQFYISARLLCQRAAVLRQIADALNDSDLTCLFGPYIEALLSNVRIDTGKQFGIFL